MIKFILLFYFIVSGFYSVYKVKSKKYGGLPLVFTFINGFWILLFMGMLFGKKIFTEHTWDDRLWTKN